MWRGGEGPIVNATSIKEDTFVTKKSKYVSCELDRLGGRYSALQAAVVTETRELHTCNRPDAIGIHNKNTAIVCSLEIEEENCQTF